MTATTVSVAQRQAELGWAVDVFLAERVRLLRVAYGVVGDRASAEDVVQEAWLRWQRVDRREIQSPAAFLSTATTRLAINLIQSARHRRESATEMPRGVEANLAPGPVEQAERAESVERMLGFLMARLTSSELAAYLLRKSFEYPYQEIADLLGTTAPNVRQLVRRAQVRIAGFRTRRVDVSAHRRLVAAFRAASDQGDVESLERLLSGSVSG